jgi:dephospho-CoA kinase
MLRVALTGGIATGKSYVRARFEAAGIPTIDADRLARDAVAPGTPGLDAVIGRFGPAFVGADGRLDRAALARVVFADAAARRDLEAIIHPWVRAAMDGWFETQRASGTPLAVADIPLLYETGRSAEFDAVVVAWCPADVQVARVRARDGATEEAARQRLAAQLPIDDKARLADYVIRTDGTFAETDAQVDETIAALKVRAGSG